LLTKPPSDVPTVSPSLFPTSAIPSPAPSKTGLIVTVTAHASVNAPITSTEITPYISEVAEYYGVLSSDVASQVIYSLSGSLSMDIPDNVSDDDLMKATQTSIASVLDIHPSIVTVDVNRDTGVVTYTIASDDFVSVANAANDLDDDDTVLVDIKELVEQSIGGVVVEAITSSSDIQGEITFSINVEDATNDLTHAEYLTAELLSEYSVNVEEAFISSAPSFTPSVFPTTSLPSASPSLTGAVAMIELSKIVNASISAGDISDIANDVASAYGVEEDDVIIEIVYETTGTIYVNLTGEVTEQEIANALEEEIASLLGIHENKVDVEFVNGTATYSISTSTAEEAFEYSDILQTPNSSVAISNVIESTFPAILDEIVVDDEIIVDVLVTVDTTDASEALDEAKSIVENIFVSQGYNTTAESI